MTVVTSLDSDLPAKMPVLSFTVLVADSTSRFTSRSKAQRSDAASRSVTARPPCAQPCNCRSFGSSTPSASRQFSSAASARFATNSATRYLSS